MMSALANRRSRGFTLIEMLIVIVVIAILALIVIPRLLGAGRKAREASLRGDLHQLRNSIQQFEADMGDYPALVTDLMASAAPATGGNSIDLDPNGWQGPYLVTADGLLPDDPFTGAADWTYVGTPGAVHSASTVAGIDGTAYSTW